MRVAARAEARAVAKGQQVGLSSFVAVPFRHNKRSHFRKLISAMLIHCAMPSSIVNYNNCKGLMTNNGTIIHVMFTFEGLYERELLEI